MGTKGGLYYEVLGIGKPTDAQGEDIAKAFRHTALKHHPELNKDKNALECQRRFALIAEAYEVLSDQKLRDVYDEHGSEGLRDGVPGSNPYRFSGNPSAVFKDFFGVENPFQMIGDLSAADGTQHQFFSESAARPRVPPQLPAKEMVAECTLEELFTGVRRQIKYRNDKLDVLGQVSGESHEEVCWDVPAGARAGEQVTFKHRGTTGEQRTPGDVHVLLKQRQHERFERCDDNLIYTHTVNLKDALCGLTVEVLTLDGRVLKVFVDEVVHPKYVKVVPGEGMPVKSAGEKRGDLHIRFQTRFPSYLDEDQRRELRQILQCSQERAA